MISVTSLREAMEKAGFKTQKQLAEASGVSAVTISKVLKRKTAREDVVKKLQQACSPHKIGPMIEDVDPVGDIFKLAEEQGNLYEFRMRRYVAVVGIQHEDKFYIRSTFSLSDPNWQEEVENKLLEFNGVQTEN